MIFDAFDFGVLPSLSELFWGIAGIVSAILTFGFAYAKFKVLHKLFPAFSEEEVYKVANLLYGTLFYLSSITIVGIVFYFITKVIFWGLRLIGEANEWLWLVQFTHTSQYGFGVMFLMIGGLFFFIYEINKRKLKRTRQSNEVNENVKGGGI